MANRLPTDLLYRSSQEASRLLALSHLDEVARAQARLSRPEDAEALHDFRVGLRRLRSCMRAYRPFLKGSISGKIRRRLRGLTLETNAGRDTEVQLAWLRDQASCLAPGEAEGLGWLVGRLEGRRSMLEQTTTRVGRRFLKLESKLRPRLLTFEVEVSPAGMREQESFGQVTAGLIRRFAVELCESVASVRHRNDESEAHGTRIRAKRLRYLIEPLSPRLPRLKTSIKRLKELQSVLGALHDMQVLGREIPATGEAGAIDAGVKALRQRSRDAAELSLNRFHSDWTPARTAAFLKRLEAAADSLAGLSQRQSGDDSAPTTDAPALLGESWTEAPLPTLSLETTPLPLRFPLQPQPRLR
jgi:CHAD domain-containing protein